MRVITGMLVLSLVDNLVAENMLVIHGGVSKLLLSDLANSEVTNATEIIGCPINTTMPDYPRKVFGSLLQHYKGELWSCGGGTFQETFSECYSLDSRSLNIVFSDKCFIFIQF